jgi:hypothetical protein
LRWLRRLRAVCIRESCALGRALAPASVPVATSGSDMAPTTAMIDVQAPIRLRVCLTAQSIQIDLVTANSLIPGSASSRPYPDRFTPPKGRS